MKKALSTVLAFVTLISSIAIIPVSAFEDTVDTKYKNGYVLHNMDFTTGEITAWSQTGYTGKCAETTYVEANTFRVNADMKYQGEGIDGSTMIGVGVNGLRSWYNDGGKAGKRTIWLTNNGIPKYVSSYTVEFKTLVHKISAEDNYFGLAYGDATNQNASKDMIIRFNGNVAGTAKTAADSTAYANIISLLKADQTQANWITYRVIVESLSAKPTIQISCGNYTAEFTANSDAQTGAYMGLIMSDGLNLNIAHIRVIAGTDYENLIWPEEEGALVQGVTDDALSAFDDTVDTKYKNGYVLHNVDFTAGDITAWSQTGYTGKCGKTTYIEANTFRVNADMKYQKEGIDGSTMIGTGVNGLRCWYNDGGSAGKRTIWLTNNSIPKYISSYIVEFKTLVHKISATDNYFGLAYGDATSQNASKDMIIRFNGNVAGTAKTAADSTAYASIIDMLKADQTQANWITYRVIVKSLSEKPTIQVTCGSYTAEFTANSDAQTGTNIGLIMSDGLNLNIAHIRVIAGTDYENLIWPEEEGALVQGVTDDALSVFDDTPVDADTIELKGYQTTEIDEDTNTFDLRLVAILDDATLDEYELLGYEVKLKAEGSKAVVLKKDVRFVYKAINCKTGRGYTEYTAEALGGEYIFALSCTDIPTDKGNITFTVTPYYLLLDGSRYNGETKSFTVDMGAAS